jgi:peptidoglycan/LPS O-acetylase OafA/YrhL
MSAQGGKMNGHAGRLAELDALRGIAALVVVVYHFSARFHEMFPAAPHLPFALAIGHDAVLLFFAISGFVIAFSLGNATSIADFAVKRAARLYPAYWGAMALTLLIEQLGGIAALQVSPGVAIANLSMLQGFAFLPQVDGVYWTLSVELAFYLCMAGLWMAGLMPRIERVMLPWLAISIAGLLWPPMPTRVSMLLVADYIPFFMIGILTARIWIGARSWAQQAPLMLAALATIGVTDGIGALGTALFLVVLFAALVAGKLRLLRAPPLLWLGAISYTLYLSHHNSGFIIMLSAEAAGLGPWSAAGLATIAAFAMAMLLHHGVEQPAIRLIRGWWARRQYPPKRPALA